MSANHFICKECGFKIWITDEEKETLGAPICPRCIKSMEHDNEH
jgi:hypothetical protein